MWGHVKFEVHSVSRWKYLTGFPKENSQLERELLLEEAYN